MYTAVPWLLPDPLIYYTALCFFADYSNQIEMVINMS
jgi:hypothetical protein